MTDFPSDGRIKHLEFIQAAITRLAGNSFLAKGWALTASAALYGLAASGSNPWLALAATGLNVAFWWLDGYFLRQERLFRCLYNDARKPDSAVEPFSMDTRPYLDDPYTAPRKVTMSHTLLVFYGALLVTGLAITVATFIHDSNGNKESTVPAVSSASVQFVPATKSEMFCNTFAIV
ncbi:hypothetical protein BZB76_2048 [Actinomadura pelletieri DSM 43383]|uniref:Uncharacterized protein n=1 Tax=Actinomadura pelletieri DSM 43383 TaxID=1120940 RepID=A0A495QTE5_9ACTN|nr:hypothetical protein [Actinomadura pelletieri]RKS76691.1 hypothetical protein BZB76_2048 [Actinomadura pelletieri DSM 43383]